MTAARDRTFRGWFWRPPRAHGAIIRDRVVSFLELFYDLVYVVVISQAAHHLAEEVSARTILEFMVVFALIWFAWLNGSLYLEIHGRNDGRTRAVVFVQMAILVLLAVFTGSATGSGGGAFAVVYALLFAVMGWLWYSVRAHDDPRYGRLTGVYVSGMAVSVVVILASAALPVEGRILVWGAFSLAWIIAFVAFGRVQEWAIAVAPTHSMAERFGLFTIIVLGEVVFGVVDGLAHAEQDLVTIGTGLLGLSVGFGFWWSYFDIVGRRLPRPDGPTIVLWFLVHLPMTMAIAGAGAAMTSLITHAHDAVTPPASAWLIAGATAVALLALVVAALTLEDARRWPQAYRSIVTTMLGGVLAALAVGWLQLAPWTLALLLASALAVVWVVAIGRFLRSDAWLGDESDEPHEAASPAAGSPAPG